MSSSIFQVAGGILLLKNLDYHLNHRPGVLRQFRCKFLRLVRGWIRPYVWNLWKTLAVPVRCKPFVASSLSEVGNITCISYSSLFRSPP